MCFAVFIQPFDTSIYRALFILHGDLFDVAVGRFLAMIKVVIPVGAFQLFKLCIFAYESEPVLQDIAIAAKRPVTICPSSTSRLRKSKYCCTRSLVVIEK